MNRVKAKQGKYNVSNLIIFDMFAGSAPGFAGHEPRVAAVLRPGGAEAAQQALHTGVAVSGLKIMGEFK